MLVAGAGPTGLVLALWLTRLGVRVRIVDKTTAPGTTSRALAVQARTLELYRQVGLADDVIARGHKVAAINLWVAGRRTARAVIGDMGKEISPFPDPLIFPQDEHERLLIDSLRESGVEVERETALSAFEETVDGVVAHLERSDGATDVCTASYIAGCDGAHSTVRETLGIRFPGGTYEHLFYVADVDARGEVMNGELHVALDAADFLAVFPLKGEGCARLIGTVRAGIDTAPNGISWDDVSRRAIERMRIEVERVNWFSTYRVHHRVADRFRSGRAFLLGDAAHIHSPVGGQGMNTGIGDAVNLAWKLAAVVQKRAPATLLDSYEPERIGFARRLVATTDRAFTGVTSSGAIARFVRMRLVPFVAPRLFSVAATRRLLFRTVSQTGVNYRGSSLSQGQAGAVRGGDRLPWIVPDASGVDNHAPLASLDWQVHVYGSAAPETTALCRDRALPLHVFPWRPEMARAGLRRDASYLVRPDGYVAVADTGRGASFAAYLDTRGLQPASMTAS